MAIQIAPKDIDGIIEQIENLQRLAKEGIIEAKKGAEPFSLSAKENNELSQFEDYEKYQNGIADFERMRFVGKDPGYTVHRIDMYKRMLSQIQVPYDAERAKELRAKSASWQEKYKKALKRFFSKNIKRLREELDIFLYARQGALGLLDYQIVNQIQGLLSVEKCHVASDQQFEDVTLKLQKIRARLVVERQHKPATQKPAETERNTTPSKEEKGNLNIEIGEIQAENVQIGYGSVHKQVQTEKKNKGVVKKALKVIVAIIAFLATLLTCLYYLGWLEPIRAFIYKVLGN